MRKSFNLLIFLLIITSLVQCAKRGTPSGGEIDTEPPRFTRATPENYTTYFDRNEVRIHFNEYIKLEKPQEQIIISPPMDPKPEISPMGVAQRYVRIRIADTLQDNTTYVVNFGNSIVDNNEGNPLPFFKYVFSTGSYIDSLTVSGNIADALLKEPEPFVSVMLYEMDENYSDSLIYTQPPLYITNTLDSLRSFQLTNLKEGVYRLIAIKDRNNDNKYNPGREKIAYLEEPVRLPADIANVYNLVLFREILPFQPERPKQLAGNKLLLGYRGRINPDSLRIEPVFGFPDDVEYRFTKVHAKDSLHIYLNPPPEADSLRFRLIAPNRIDTLFTRFTTMPLDTLQVALEPTGNLDFGRNIILRANTPIIEANDELISLMNRDSVNIPFTSQLSSIDNTVAIDFKKEENQTYRLSVLPGGVVDFYGKTNDSLQRAFNTRALSDLGSVTLNLQNIRSFPIIVQLTDEKGVVRLEQYSTSQSMIRFEFLSPGKYLARVIYDQNENGIWDTGSFLENQQPEPIFYFPDVLDVRPNWDINETFNVN